MIPKRILKSWAAMGAAPAVRRSTGHLGRVMRVPWHSVHPEDKEWSDMCRAAAPGFMLFSRRLGVSEIKVEMVKASDIELLDLDDDRVIQMARDEDPSAFDEHQPGDGKAG